MQTALADFIKNTPQGQEADAILRSCVHCGFCLATCPTYALLGDELDSPRGRIYLIKQMLEGQPVTAKTQSHLDRCMTCLSCETTCPSGVRYGRLLDIGRQQVAQQVEQRSHRWLRWGLQTVALRPALFSPLLRLGQWLRPVLPEFWRHAIPPQQVAEPWPKGVHERRMLIPDGCVQPACAPRINAATARVLDRLNISVIRAPGCCGALSYHLGDQEAGKDYMRRNIDAIVMTASGCGAMVKEYGYVLRHDPAYADKAARMAALTRDISEILDQENLCLLGERAARKIAFHAPCSLQHGQRLSGVVERLLRGVGFTLTHVADAHLCCGSAGGVYAFLHRNLSQQTLSNKLNNLQTGEPELIATANIGCLLHLQSRARIPVLHWIELLEPTANPARG
jgi:glycolate oxidase iron-sulfur subunit